AGRAAADNGDAGEGLGHERQGLAGMARILAGVMAGALRGWIHGLGIDTFVGTSGRVFPTDMKAAPLLRAWL
ncbi:NAD(P)/FAD-dependent oxidoreductase, partial [Pseudomonas otitidis]